MPTRPAVLAATAVLLAVSGCGKGVEATTPATVAESTVPVVPVAPVEVPAATAGGACTRWDYDLIERTIGVRFAVAASDRAGDTSTCVVQATGRPWPDLSLSVVEGATASAEVFLDERMPPAATKLKGLGKAGYRLTSKATAQHGPTVEIGWLSRAGQLQTLRFTFAGGAAAPKVNEMSVKLLDLAEALSTTGN